MSREPPARARSVQWRRYRRDAGVPKGNIHRHNESCRRNAAALAAVSAPYYRRRMAVADTDPEFDTLACAQTLKEAGVGEKQAEAHAETVRTVRAGLATKTDLDTGLGLFETRLEARISGLETRMLRVAIAIVPAQTALTAALTAGLMFGGAP